MARQLELVKVKPAGHRQADPVGHSGIERPIHPQDLHATILHALGIDQRKLYYVHHNRKELVTVNGADVIVRFSVGGGNNHDQSMIYQMI